MKNTCLLLLLFCSVQATGNAQVKAKKDVKLETKKVLQDTLKFKWIAGGKMQYTATKKGPGGKQSMVTFDNNKNFTRNVPGISLDFANKEKRLPDGSVVKTRFSTVIGTAGQNAGPKKRVKNVAVENGDGWTCQTAKVKVSLSDDSFMSTHNEQQNTYIYPGAVYTFDNFYGGSFNEEKAARNPIRISTTAGGVNGNIYEIVDEPTGIEIRNAKNKLDNRTPETRGNGGYKSIITECTNQAQMALSFGASMSGYGASLNFGYGTKKNEYDRYFTIDATQEVYSMTAEMPVEGVFQNPEDAKKKGLMFLSSITYGMRVLVSVKTTIRSTEDALKFGASYSGFGFGASVDLNTLQKTFNSTTEVKMYVVGGENTGFLEIEPSQLMQKLNSAFTKLSNKTAKPLYYSFRSMGNAVIKTTSATDEFTERQCVPAAADENKRYYNITVALTNMRQTTNQDEVSIAAYVDADLMMNGKQEPFNEQRIEDPAPVKVGGIVMDVPASIQPASLYYFGKTEPEQMIKDYGKPVYSHINFRNAYRMGNPSAIKTFSKKLTAGEIKNSNAHIITTIKALCDYMNLDEYKNYKNAHKEIVYLKDYLTGAAGTAGPKAGAKTFSIYVPHIDSKTYVFDFQITVTPLDEFVK